MSDQETVEDIETNQLEIQQKILKLAARESARAWKLMAKRADIVAARNDVSGAVLFAATVCLMHNSIMYNGGEDIRNAAHWFDAVIQGLMVEGGEDAD